MCATVVHQESGRSDRGSKLCERIATADYEACKAKKLNLDGFPDASPLLAEVQRISGVGGNSQVRSASFKVTSHQPNGALVIKETFHEQFGELDEFQEVLQHHNKMYNKDGTRLKETMASPRRPEPTETAKTVVVSDANEPMTSEKLVALPNTSWPQTVQGLYGVHIVVTWFLSKEVICVCLAKVHTGYQLTSQHGCGPSR